MGAVSREIDSHVLYGSGGVDYDATFLRVTPDRVPVHAVLFGEVLHSLPGGVPGEDFVDFFGGQKGLNFL